MPFDAPFRLGPFIVNSQGRMEPNSRECFPTFHLVWRGCAVQAHLEHGEADLADVGRLVFVAIAGRVSSTAGGNAASNAARRDRTLAAVRGLGGAVGLDWRVRLLPDHRVAMQTGRQIAFPISAVDLLTQITCCLLDLAPYLDVLEEADVAAGAAEPEEVAGSGGTRNT